MGLWPALPMALLLALCEFGGGLLILLGFLTLLGALAVAPTIIVAMAAVTEQDGFFKD
jgi:uncharacterized membrane protein YphA (DoxX/SURF4 family)